MTHAFPLAWPSGWPRRRIGSQQDARFRAGGRPISMDDARRRLATEMDRLGASAVVLSSNVELRIDGTPRSEKRLTADPGVALYFRLAGGDMVLACDRWNSVAANIAAIAAHVEALRGIDRWGVGSMERTFAGYLRLSPPPDWRGLLENPRTLEEAKRVYLAKMRTMHPDVGGDGAAAAALNDAYARAQKELS